MSGSGTTGENGSPKSKGILWPKAAFLERVGVLRASLRVIGPVGTDRHTCFREIDDPQDLALDYQRTMIPPGKKQLFLPQQELVRFELGEERATATDIPPAAEPAVLLGVHPCDLHAILYLDRTLLGDPHYQARRRHTLLIGLNCTRVSPFCFCSSVGTGPHLQIRQGYDGLLTDLGDRYLFEPVSAAGVELFAGGEPAGPEAYRLQEEQHRQALEAISKRLVTQGLDELLLGNQDHPVWERTAEERCLSCTNCVMVCPTCFCHDVVDEVDMSLKTVTRLRQWDACQDLRFAAVHGGNFRRLRAARLRQFVMHKLNYTAQYGMMGTVGCGRCIEWCPTGIDLTEMAAEIQRDPGGKSIPAR
jgi:sulfhydrogenase subunit beta (sulfur reductase)